MEVGGAFDEIDVRRIDDEEIAGRVVEEEVFVGFDDFFEVIVADAFFGGGIALLETLLEDIHRGLQVDDELRRRELRAEHLIVAVVHVEFGVAKIEVGEELVFFEDVIDDDDLARSGSDLELPQLFVALDEERELRLEGGSGLIAFHRSRA